jgi:pimeloyl-ACP methyl ester carboxylesterase
MFESSGFGTAVSSSKARTEVAGQTRVCSYDRMGTGWSDAGPAVISVGELAGDLDHLLTFAEIEPPYILVAASIGGLTAELFARRYPERVAGLVFVDAATSGAIDRALPEVTWMRTQLLCLAPLAARVGLVRLIDPLDLQGSGEDRARGVALTYRPEPIATLCGIVRGAAATAAEFRTAGPLAPDVPLIVLSADSNKGLLPPGVPADRFISVAERHAFHEAFSRRSSQGRWQVVPGSTHLIASSHPHVVAGAVIEMVAAARRRQASTAGGS